MRCAARARRAHAGQRPATEARSSVLRALITLLGEIPNRSARVQPLPSQPSGPGAWVPVSMANMQSASAARRSTRPGRAPRATRYRLT